MRRISDQDCVLMNQPSVRCNYTYTENTTGLLSLRVAVHSYGAVAARQRTTPPMQPPMESAGVLYSHWRPGSCLPCNRAMLFLPLETRETGPNHLTESLMDSLYSPSSEKIRWGKPQVFATSGVGATYSF